MGSPGRERDSAFGDSNILRRWVRIGASIWLVVNIAVGLLAFKQQHAILTYALGIYDTVFISTNYIHLAQTSFQIYADKSGRDGTLVWTEELDKVLNNLEVVIDRSDSPPIRSMVSEVKKKIAALRTNKAVADESRSLLLAIQKDLEELGSRASG